MWYQTLFPKTVLPWVKQFTVTLLPTAPSTSTILADVLGLVRTLRPVCSVRKVRCRTAQAGTPAAAAAASTHFRVSKRETIEALEVRHPAPGMTGLAPAHAAGRATRPFLTQPHRHVHRAALEPELLPQPPLDEPPVAGLQETGREQHEVRRPDARLGREEDLGLPAAPHRR